jgi:hypothetical protein
VANSEHVRHWFQDKKAGWYAVLADPQVPVTSPLLDQAHHAIERKLFAMKRLHHPGGSQQGVLRGVTHLDNLVPYQRRVRHVGQCGVEVEGGTVPTRDWFLQALSYMDSLAMSGGTGMTDARIGTAAVISPAAW